MGVEVRESADRRLAGLYREMRDGGVFWFHEARMFGALNRVDCLVVTSYDYHIVVEVKNYGQVKVAGVINEFTEGGRELNFRTQCKALTVDVLVQMWSSR